MSSTEFIIEELDAFLEMFPQAHARYEFDKEAIAHIVEITPKELYDNDDQFYSWQCKLFDTFVEKYPTENIGFITDDAIVGIDKPIYDKQGICFLHDQTIQKKPKTKKQVELQY